MTTSCVLLRGRQRKGCALTRPHELIEPDRIRTGRVDLVVGYVDNRSPEMLDPVASAAIADAYGVSETLVAFRTRITDVEYQLRAAWRPSRLTAATLPGVATGCGQRTASSCGHQRLGLFEKYAHPKLSWSTSNVRSDKGRSERSHSATPRTGVSPMQSTVCSAARGRYADAGATGAAQAMREPRSPRDAVRTGLWL